MSDTSIIASKSSYGDENKRRRAHHHNSSCCGRYWFHIIVTLLLLIIVAIIIALVYVLHKQYQRDQQRQKIQNDFKRKHGVSNKVLDMISKEGFIGKWLKKNKNSVISVFRQLLKEMVEAIFG